MTNVEEINRIIEESKIKTIYELSSEKIEMIKGKLFRILYDEENYQELFSVFQNINSSEWFEKILTEIKEDGAFSIKKLIFIEKISLLTFFFSNLVVVNRIKNVKNDYKEILNNDEILALKRELDDITNFCITRNYPGEEFKNILIQIYKCPENISNEIAKIYDENILNIKMNFIIRELALNTSKTDK